MFVRVFVCVCLSACLSIAGARASQSTAATSSTMSVPVMSVPDEPQQRARCHTRTSLLVLVCSIVIDDKFIFLW